MLLLGDPEAVVFVKKDYVEDIPGNMTGNPAESGNLLYCAPGHGRKWCGLLEISIGGKRIILLDQFPL